MAIIDPDGLFHGERLKHCSDTAQLYFPRYLLAANGFGRVRLDYSRLVDGPLSTLNARPSMKDVILVFKEYHKHYLAFMYVADGDLWAQWDVPRRLLSKYQTASDRRSPAPPDEAYRQWQGEYVKQKESRTVDLLDCEVIYKTEIVKNQQPASGLENSPNHIEPHQTTSIVNGDGIGNGVGEGEVKKQEKNSCLALVPSAPQDVPFIRFPLNDGSEHPVGVAEVLQYKQLYPAVNIEQGLRSMLGWLLADPTRRKTKRGINKFINGWLAREQDKGGNGNGRQGTNAADAKLQRIYERQYRVAAFDAARQSAGGGTGDTPAGDERSGSPVLEGCVEGLPD